MDTCAELHENLTNGLVADTRSQNDGQTDGRSFLLPLLHRFVKQSEDKAEICTADTAEEEVRFMAR
jgi:oligoribonuclease (3'-5' exoribonuclease)